MIFFILAFHCKFFFFLLIALHNFPPHEASIMQEKTLLAPSYYCYNKYNQRSLDRCVAT